MNYRFAAKTLLSLSMVATLSAQAESLSQSEEEFLKTAGDEWVAAGEHTYRIESEHGFTQLAFGRDAAMNYLATLKAQKAEQAATKKALANGPDSALDQTIATLEHDLQASAPANHAKAALSYDGPAACGQGWTLSIETKPAATSFRLSSTTDFGPAFGPHGPAKVRLYSSSVINPSGQPQVDDYKTLEVQGEQYSTIGSSVISQSKTGNWSSYGAIYNQNCANGWVTLTKQGVY